MNSLFTKSVQQSQDAALIGVCTPGEAVKVTRPECVALVESYQPPEKGGLSIADLDVQHPELESVFTDPVSPLRPRLVVGNVREKIRKKKKPTDLSMRQVYILGENGFYSKPNSFVSKARWANNEDESAQAWNQYREIFDKASMPEMAQIVKLISDSNKDTGDSWLGFKRMRPFDAAVTLAHLHSFGWHDLLYIIVSMQKLPDIFAKYQTLAQACPVADTEASKNFLKALGQREQKARNFDYLHMAYRPRMYPIHEFGHTPVMAAKIVENCEAMTELNGKPGFDYYWVLVPSVSLQHPMTCHPDGVYRVQIDGKVVESKDENDVAIALDKFLVSEKIVAPCILGERDGKCYFLGMWS